MKSCKMFRPMLSAYAANELSEPDRHSIGVHLSSCEECRESAQKTLVLRSLLALKRHEQPGELFYRHFLSGVRQRLYSEVWVRPSLWQRIVGWFEIPVWSSSMLRGVTAVAAVAALLLSLALWFREPTREDTKFTEQIKSRSHPNVVYVLDRVPHKTSASDSSVVTF
jgi:anti-sigma factor RsiW